MSTGPPRCGPPVSRASARGSARAPARGSAASARPAPEAPFRQAASVRSPIFQTRSGKRPRSKREPFKNCSFEAQRDPHGPRGLQRPFGGEAKTWSCDRHVVGGFGRNGTRFFSIFFSRCQEMFSSSKLDIIIHHLYTLYFTSMGAGR